MRVIITVPDTSKYQHLLSMDRNAEIVLHPTEYLHGVLSLVPDKIKYKREIESICAIAREKDIRSVAFVDDFAMVPFAYIEAARDLISFSCIQRVLTLSVQRTIEETQFAVSIYEITREGLRCISHRKNSTEIYEPIMTALSEVPT